MKYLIDEINKIINALNKKENQLTQNENNNIKRTINKRYQKSNIKNESIMRKLKNQKKIIISNKNKKRTNYMKYKKKNNDNFNKNNKRKLKFQNILKYIDSELNSLPYKDALRKDKRSYTQYYCSLLKKKQPILFSFFPNRDYNSQIIKFFLFFLFFCF